MVTKQSSPKASTIAAKVMAGKQPNKREALTLAGSVLSQDEKRGQSNKK